MIEIRIASPCDQTWTAMKGDAKVRHCGACRKSVYNIAEMTEGEIEELIRRTEGKFCARVYRRTDGRVLTKDCPRGVARVCRRRTLAVTAAMTAVGIAWSMVTPTMGQAARPNRHLRKNEVEPPMMGKIDPPVRIEMGAPVAVRMGDAVIASKPRSQ